MHKEELKYFHLLHPNNKAYDYQEDWVTDESKFKLAVKARQIGITYATAVEKFLKCASWMESKLTPLPPVVVFCSPSQRQSNRLMHYIQRIRTKAEEIFQERIYFKKEREDHMIFDTGAELFSLPNNPRTVEGIDASEGIIDEVSNFITGEDEDVYQAIMGSLAAKNGSITLFSRPRGRRGLLWKLFDPYGEFQGKFSIHTFPYAVRARHDKDYEKAVLEQKERMLPLSFEEQYNCAFVDEFSLVFGYELITRQSKPYRLLNDHELPDGNSALSMGIDFARKIDETVVSIVECVEPTSKLIYQEASTLKFDQQILWIKNLIEHFKPFKSYVDETGLGLPILDFLNSKFQGTVEGVHFSNQMKEKIILNLKGIFEESRLVIPETAQDLIDQLHGMEKEVTKMGRAKYTGKRSESDWLDDRVWSLGLACLGLGESDWAMTSTEGEIFKAPDALTRWMRDMDEYGNPI